MDSEYQRQSQQSQQQLPLSTSLPKAVPAPKTFLQYSSELENDFFDKFHFKKVCTVPVTSHKQKQDAVLAVRPKQGTCLDYHISETDTKLDAGMTRIHIRQVNATYEPFIKPKPSTNEPVFELEAPPPPKKRKRNPFHNKYCHAREPVFEFAEEKHARKVMKEQEFYKRRLEERIARTNSGKHV